MNFQVGSIVNTKYPPVSGQVVQAKILAFNSDGTSAQVELLSGSGPIGNDIMPLKGIRTGVVLADCTLVGGP